MASNDQGGPQPQGGEIRMTDDDPVFSTETYKNWSALMAESEEYRRAEWTARSAKDREVKRLKEALEDALDDMGKILGDDDTSDACRRVGQRKIAEALGWELGHYRLLMEREIRPLYHPENYDQRDRLQVLDELAAEAQELGFYDAVEETNRKFGGALKKLAEGPNAQAPDPE